MTKTQILPTLSPASPNAGVTRTRRYPSKSVMGAAVIIAGAGVAMIPPISRLIEAQAAHGDGDDDDTTDREYDADRLRGVGGDYAIVEGKSRRGS